MAAVAALRLLLSFTFSHFFYHPAVSFLLLGFLVVPFFKLCASGIFIFFQFCDGIENLMKISQNSKIGQIYDEKYKISQIIFFQTRKKKSLPPPLPKNKKIIGLHTNTSYNICVENIHKYTRYVEYACAYERKKAYTTNEIVRMGALNCFEELISENGHLNVIITNVVCCTGI